MGTVLVLADGNGDRSTGALLAMAGRIGTPTAVLCGPVSAVRICSAGLSGARTVYTVLERETDCPVSTGVAALVTLAHELAPVAIVVPAGHVGREIAARVAVRLDAGIVTDVTEVRPGSSGPIATTFRGESVAVRGLPVLAAAAAVATPAEAAVPAEPVVATVEVTPAGRVARVVARVPRDRAESRDRADLRGRAESRGRTDLAGATVVVAGGHGVGSRDSFGLVSRVADALGGSAAGTHTATELGWCPKEACVDQLGTVVHPDLYVALGISGSVRHRAGMQTAGTIVAIARDRNAPIFDIADFGVVGDLHQVVPALLAEIARRRAEIAERGAEIAQQRTDPNGEPVDYPTHSRPGHHRGGVRAGRPAGADVVSAGPYRAAGGARSQAPPGAAPA